MNNQFLSVNWADGMRLSSEHFIAAEQCIHNEISNTAQLCIRSYSYGLLPSGEADKEALDVTYKNSPDGGLQVNVKRCYAITSGGCRITMDADSYPDRYGLTTEISSDMLLSAETAYMLVICVQPEEYVLIGEPHPDESPLRHPYKSRKYGIKIVGRSAVNPEELKEHHLVIGYVIRHEGHFQPADNYIPCAVGMQAHPMLKKWHGEISDQLEMLKKHVLRIAARQGSPEKGFMHGEIQLLSRRIIDYLTAISYNYRCFSREQCPARFMEYFVTLAAGVEVQLQLVNQQQREEIVQYFSEWLNCMPGQFEDTVAVCARYEYDHHDISAGIAVCNNFMSMLTTLYGKLAELEFIGQRKENIVITQDAPGPVIQPARKSWVLLD